MWEEEGRAWAAMKASSLGLLEGGVRLQHQCRVGWQEGEGEGEGEVGAKCL